MCFIAVTLVFLVSGLMTERIGDKSDKNRDIYDIKYWDRLASLNL